MKVVAVSVGRPREIQWRGQSVRTSIFKTPLSTRVHTAGDNLEGDEQSDLSVHGGRDKAVYAYPMEHYDFWRRELRMRNCPGAHSEKILRSRVSWKTWSALAIATRWVRCSSLSRNRVCPATSLRPVSGAPTLSSGS